MTYGWVMVRRGMDQRERDREEKRRARLALVPTLVAERDRRTVQYQEEWDRMEAKVMADVPGWEVGRSVYKTVNYMPPVNQFHPMTRLAAYH